MNGLDGKWRLYQKWDGAPKYHMTMILEPSGTLTIENHPQYFGTYTYNEENQTIELAIADFSNNHSISIYKGGRVWLFSFGGTAQGANRRSPNQTVAGSWSMQAEPMLETEELGVLVAGLD